MARAKSKKAPETPQLPHNGSSDFERGVGLAPVPTEETDAPDTLQAPPAPPGSLTPPPPAPPTPPPPNLPTRSAAPALPPQQKPAPATPRNGTPSPVTFGKIERGAGDRILLFGAGGSGKTSLAAVASGPVAFFDTDRSLPKLKRSFDESGLDLDLRPVNVETWQDIRDALHAPGWDDIKTIVIDSVTVAERLCIEHIIGTVKHEKGQTIKRIEDYGYGKGFTHSYEEFLRFLADCESHSKAGRNVILIAHVCTNKVPNTQGDDYPRYEPRLQHSESGKNSIRLATCEWADHVVSIVYDVNVKDGKGEGVGTRSAYTYEQPFTVAKSRTWQGILPLDQFDPTLWNNLLE